MTRDNQSSNQPDRENLMLPKNFSASQINWVGLITAGISILGYIQADNYIAQYPRAVAVIGGVIGILTITLRFVDKQPVRLPFQSAKDNGEY
jgi:hypothetical protein